MFHTIMLDHGQEADAERLLADVENGLAIARARAVRRTGEQTKTVVVGAVTSETTLKRRDVDGDRPDAHRYGGVKLAVGDEVARVSVTGRRIPLYRWGAKPHAPPTRHGVSYQISRGTGRKRISSNAFILITKSGHVGVFRREGKKRLPVQELYGPSIPQVTLSSVALRDKLDVDVPTMLESNMDRQVRFLLTGGTPRD